MFLIIITVISIIVAMIRKGSFSNLLDNGIKAWYLFAASVLVFLLLKIGDTLGLSFVQNYAKFFLLAAYALLLVGTAFNLSNLWMYPLLVGAVLNFIVIFINGGKMPLSATAIKIAGLSATSVEASAMTSVANTSTSLTFLSGIIPIPLPSVLADVISPGTLLISVGLFFIIQNVLLGIVYEYDDDDDFYDADDYDYEQRVYDEEPSESADTPEKAEQNITVSKNTLPIQEHQPEQNEDENDYENDRDYTDDVFSFEEFDQSESLPEIDTLLAAGDDDSEQDIDLGFLIDNEPEQEAAPAEEANVADETINAEEESPESEVSEDEVYESETIPSIEEIVDDSELDFSEEDFSTLFNFDDGISADFDEEETEPAENSEETEESKDELFEDDSAEVEDEIPEDDVQEEKYVPNIEEPEDVPFEDITFEDLFKDDDPVGEEIFDENSDEQNEGEPETEAEEVYAAEPDVSNVEIEITPEPEVSETIETIPDGTLDEVLEEIPSVKEDEETEIKEDEIGTVSDLSGKDYTSDEFAEYGDDAAENAEPDSADEEEDQVEEEIDIDSPFIIIDGKIVENPNYKFRKGVGQQSQVVARDWSKGVVHENEQTPYTPPVQEKKVVEISNNIEPEVSSDGFEKVEMKIGDVQIKFWKREND